MWKLTALSKIHDVLFLELNGYGEQLLAFSELAAIGRDRLYDDDEQLTTTIRMHDGRCFALENTFEDVLRIVTGTPSPAASPAR